MALGLRLQSVLLHDTLEAAVFLCDFRHHIYGTHNNLIQVAVLQHTNFRTVIYNGLYYQQVYRSLYKAWHQTITDSLLSEPQKVPGTEKDSTSAGYQRYTAKI